MQMPLHGGNRQHALMRIFQLQPGLLRLDRARLDEQDAGDDLQAVGDPVLDLLQQHVLFPHQLLEPPLDRAPVGNVLEGKQDGGMGALLVENLARVEQHGAPPDRGKLAIDFVAFDCRLVCRDRV